MKTNKLPLILLSVFSLLLSCEKNEDEFFINSNIPLLRQVYSNTDLLFEYTYNTSNQIIEVKSMFSYTKYNYNSNHNLSSSDYYVDPSLFSSCSLITDKTMSRTEWVNPKNTEKNITNYYLYKKNHLFQHKNSSNSNYSEFSYNGGGRIIRQIMYYEGKKSSYIDYLYDTHGNLIKKSRYSITTGGVAELSTTTDYEFDSYHNPYKAFSSLLMPGEYTNTNNIIKETYTLHFEVGASIDKVQITENTYNYNEKGYPTRKNGTMLYVYN